VNSMTGFGQGAARADGLAVQVELSSVNRKNLDVQLSLPKGYSALEARCLEVVRPTLHRGRIQGRVLIDSEEKDACHEFNAERAEAWISRINAFAATHGLHPLDRVADVLPLPEVVAERRDPPDMDAVWSAIREALVRALEELTTMRKREGAHLKQVLEELIGETEEIVAELEPKLPEARKELADKLRAGMEELGTLSEEMEARVVQEIALYAEKTDVREEVDRLKGHLAQARNKLASEEPTGRGLDFLCQELAREFNTLSVKVSRADLNRLALRGKEKVDMLREQVQNVE